MNVILKESVIHLGRAGEVVRTKGGFARNYLIPKGLAMIASKANMAVLESQRSEMEKAEADKRKEGEVIAKKIEALELSLAVEVNDEGHLFGSVGIVEVAKVLASHDINVSKQDVVLPTQITGLGDFPVEVMCHVDVVAKLNLKVIKH